MDSNRDLPRGDPCAHWPTICGWRGEAILRGGTLPDLGGPMVEHRAIPDLTVQVRWVDGTTSGPLYWSLDSGNNLADTSPVLYPAPLPCSAWPSQVSRRPAGAGDSRL